MVALTPGPELQLHWLAPTQGIWQKRGLVDTRAKR